MLFLEFYKAFHPVTFVFKTHLGFGEKFCNFIIIYATYLQLCNPKSRNR